MAHQGRIGRATTASRVHRPRPRQTPRDGPYSVLENGLQWAAHLDRLKILLPDRLDQLHSLSLVDSRASHSESRSKPPRGACPNWQRDAPPSCAPASPPAGRHAQRAKPLPNPAAPGPPAKRPARAAPAAVARAAPAALPSNKQGSGSRTSTPHLPVGTNGGQWACVGPVYAAQPGGRGPGPRPRPRPRADVGRGCSEQNLATRTSTETSLPGAAGTLGAVKGTAHGGCDTASLTSESKPILVIFWKAYLSIKQPLTAHGPIHLKVSSRHDP